MDKVYVVKIQHDYETSERAGAGGMFQVISCVGELADEHTINLNVDCGVHYHDNNEVIEHLKKTYAGKYDFSSVDVVDDD